MDISDHPGSIECLDTILTARSLTAAQQALDAFLTMTGFGGYSFGLVWGNETMIDCAATFHGGNLTGVVPVYLAEGMVAIDPIARAVRQVMGPVLWTDCLTPVDRSGEPHGLTRLRQLLESQRLHAGVAIPVTLPSTGCRGALSVSAQTDCSPHEFRALYEREGRRIQLAALCLGIALDPLLTRPGCVALSSSEVLVLGALAEGLRPREIAQRLGKSEHTIRNQIVSAQQRLGVRTKEQAIVAAIRMGLIPL